MTPRPPFISFIKKQEKWSGMASLSLAILGNPNLCVHVKTDFKTLFLSTFTLDAMLNGLYCCFHLSHVRAVNQLWLQEGAKYFWSLSIVD